MATFALVHGAWHGAWCFERLVPELENRGHAAVAVELPIDNVAAGLGDYAATVASALEDTGDAVAVVGHSFGGLTIPLLPALRPVRKLVFLAAFVPAPGVSADQEFERGSFSLAPGAGEGRDTDSMGRTFWSDAGRATELLYHDCPLDAAQAAIARLRPQAQGPSAEPNPLEAWPEIESAYIRCGEDRMHTAEFARAMAGDRLGVEPIEIPGGHSPMLSRPAQLAEVLAGLL